MNKRWSFREVDEEKIAQLRKELPIHPVLCKLLIQRGITTYDEAEAFFRPSLGKLHDPFLMKDMDKAVGRIEQAIQNKEKILVYGDYDVDGTTSVALVYGFLQGYHDRLEYYIPNRYSEGYGISYKGIDWAVHHGFSLIIALDCGIKDVEKVAYAKEKEVEFIICDHHLPGEELPDGVAVLDPKRSDCSYPYKELSGCGIGFKLIQAFAKKRALEEEQLYKHMDLVAISIASDIVPMTEENRTMAYHGLKILNDKPRQGIDALIEMAGISREQVDDETGEVVSREITVSDIVFVLGPRINAAGRMDDAKEAVKMMVETSHQTAIDKAGVLDVKNRERKNIDEQTTEEALLTIERDPVQQKKKTTVLFNAEWHKGVIGIVASRLIEKYHRPTILLTESNGMATGSARSVKGFDIHEAISQCEDLLEQYGGHKYAAGLTLKLDNVPHFIEKFEEVVSATIPDELLIPEISLDAELDLKEVTPSFFKILKQFAPFGPGNMRPVFLSKSVEDSGHSRVVGDNHLKLGVKHKGGAAFYGIAFEKGDLYEKVSSQAFDICYALRENKWKGRTSIEMDVKDIKFNQSENTN